MPTTRKAATKGTTKARVQGQRVTTGSKTLAVSAPGQARFPRLVRELERAFKEAGCPGCRSGIDRIVFQDRVLGNVR
jgi:hypothetical protein